MEVFAIHHSPTATPHAASITAITAPIHTKLDIIPLDKKIKKTDT